MGEGPPRREGKRRGGGGGEEGRGGVWRGGMGREGEGLSPRTKVLATALTCFPVQVPEPVKCCYWYILNILCVHFAITQFDCASGNVVRSTLKTNLTSFYLN